MVHFGNLAKITLCAKPNCSTGNVVLHRHHKGCEAMFVRHLRETRGGQLRYRAFVQRYFMFHPEDVVKICEDHHAEIHKLYMPIIRRYLRRVRKGINDLSWDEVDALRSELIEYCDRWLTRETRGASWADRKRRRR
jgi:hypothetical protein